MQAEPSGGLRGFLRSRLGRVVFVLLAVGVVFGTFTYVSTVLAIPVFLLVGLALPIYVGLKRPRFLALAALVVLVAVAPLATVVYSQELLVPPGAASSPGTGPYESGGSVLQNATISPFTGSPSTTYTWNVTVYPKFLDSSLNGTNWSNDSVELFLSTCPGATSANSSYCSGGYSLIVLNQSFAHLGVPTNGTVVTFQHHLPSSGVWSWQLELVIQNRTNPSSPTRIELVGDPTYDGLEGPIVGGFSTAYVALIGTIYEIDLVYLGLPFYFLLLLYMWFKGREARRNQAIRRATKAMGVPSNAPTGPAAPGAPPSQGAASTPALPPSPAPSELACPSCGAVVYTSESKCWKCGASLSKGSGPPLSSAP